MEMFGRFLDEDAIIHLMGAIRHDSNDEWSVRRTRDMIGKHRPDRDDPLLGLATLATCSRRHATVIVVARLKLYHAMGYLRLVGKVYRTSAAV